MTDTPARLLKLLSLLQTPREWPGSELAERLGVSARTVRRDVERLRELGYPVQASLGAVGGYRLAAGKAMPPLLLDDEEAVAIAVGLRTAAGSAISGIEEASVRALAKLVQVLPTRLRHRVTALNAATVPLPGGGPAIDPELLAALAGAVAGPQRLRFAYRAADGAESRRQVEPHRLVATGHRWYLVAFDNDRDDWRIFRVDRITAAQPTGVRCPPRELPAPDAAAYVAGKLRERARTYRAVVVLPLSAAEVARRLGGAPVELEELDERRCRLRSGADTLEWLAFRLLTLGCDFEVEEPAELVSHLRELGGRITRATGPAIGPATGPVAGPGEGPEGGEIHRPGVARCPAGSDGGR
ncbi:YafY family transcriptional regulator [Kitasatospora sp. NBC_01250]|uniref:helix-turn-helix transcriptional regulator n=1 Tax=unclassified Kitasatospora TaxID=2633591 RepID=UPI002E0DA55A|nr:MULTISPECIES: YafY family protein [unclassified Kitasatospora]WSJ70634.1 YafY family transcriptional regulator [Kitasatospora sp. NBC_01302]